MKNQLTQELQHLTTSYAQLKQAQAKFADCGVSVREGVVGRGEGMFDFFLWVLGGKMVGEWKGTGRMGLG